MPGQFSGVNLRAIREREGWTREQLAIEVVRTAQTVACWERGAKTPHPDTILVIARALGVQPRELMATVPPSSRKGRAA